MKRGLFITVEGCEGVGKSSNIETVCELLRQRGQPFICTREPGGTPLAEDLRDLLLANREEAVDPVAELLIMFAARAQHLREVIRPALEAGNSVVCDRFTDATVAYQGHGRELDLAMIEQLRGLVHPDIEPDITVLLDLDVGVALERALNRGEPDRFEQAGTAFFERVRHGYLQQAEADPHRYLVIDASQTLEQVRAALAAELGSRLETLNV